MILILPSASYSGGFIDVSHTKTTRVAAQRSLAKHDSLSFVNNLEHQKWISGTSDSLGQVLLSILPSITQKQLPTGPVTGRFLRVCLRGSCSSLPRTVDTRYDCMKYNFLSKGNIECLKMCFSFADGYMKEVTNCPSTIILKCHRQMLLSPSTWLFREDQLTPSLWRARENAAFPHALFRVFFFYYFRCWIWPPSVTSR